MEELILGALEHQWSGRWRPFMPGLRAFLVEGDTGLFVSYSEGRAIFAAGALVDVPLTPETVVAVSDLNPKLPPGGLHIGQQNGGKIALLVVVTLRGVAPPWRSGIAADGAGRRRQPDRCRPYGRSPSCPSAWADGRGTSTTATPGRSCSRVTSSGAARRVDN